MLALAGYSVASPREPLDAILLLQQEDFLAVLIGHTVPSADAAIIAAKARKFGIASIFVYQGNVAAPDWADLSVENDSGVGTLLNFLDQKQAAAS